MELFKINNLTEYQALLTCMHAELSALNLLENKLFVRFKLQGAFNLEGYSWPIKAASRFIIDGQYSESEFINWRERLVCRKTKLNNRIRSAIHVLEQAFLPTQQDTIYLTEQHTALYQWFKKSYAQVKGSEYLTGSTWFNRLKFRLRLFTDSLVHQDIIQLTHPDNAFNYVLSFDFFEHILGYQAALKELYRVIKPGGKLLFSVPFDDESNTTLIRVSNQQNGSTTHHVEPEYHGNPVSKKGSLSYYTLG